MHASGLCHTDLEVIQGSLAYPLPIVLGHEGAGVVEAVGSDVTQVKPGDHVSARGIRTAAIASTASATCRSCASRSPATSRKGMLLDGTLAHVATAADVHHYLGDFLARAVQRRARIRRDRGAGGDSVRSRLHDRLRRDDRRGCGGAQGESRSREPTCR